jgi:hypothetical protein
MSKKIVKRNVNLASLPPLTEKQKAELTALAARPDSDIDFGDIPPLTDEFWKNAVRGKYYKPIKTSTTVRDRFRCTGLGPGSREGLPVPHQLHSAA